jgi:hypothetical protein
MQREWMNEWFMDTRKAPVVCDKRDQVKLVYTYDIGAHRRSERCPHGGQDNKGHERLLEVHHGNGFVEARRTAPMSLMDREKTRLDSVYLIIIGIRHKFIFVGDDIEVE